MPSVPALLRRRLALAAGASTLLAACRGLGTPAPDAPVVAAVTDPDQPPPAPREWRAAWVASVAHIDWPSQPGRSVAQQRSEATAFIDRSAALGLNALILQVRPAGDALYPSALEPWSEYLTGTQGRAPVPGWDPLHHWISECHGRGIELHAWFNPYRARHSSARSPLAGQHLARRQPGLAKVYGDQRWFDPGEADAASHTLAVISDVARRYDIDGVHVDDYFYPYPVRQGEGEDRPFPDDPSWQAYRRSGGRLARDDWRRDNVDRLVEALYREVHRIRPWLKVGISPFGIGKPSRRPPGIEGFSQFDKLYADVERWCSEGWFDYLAPQLYWPLARAPQAFEVLSDYWLSQNPQQRHLWPGLFSSQVANGNRADGPNPPWPVDEVLAQVAALRRRPGIGGHTHFSLTTLANNRAGLASRLQAEAYAQAALVPATPWLDATAPGAPQVLLRDGGWQLLPHPDKPVWRWAVWRRVAGQWVFSAQAAADTALSPLDADRMVISAIDRVGNESPRVAWPGASG